MKRLFLLLVFIFFQLVISLAAGYIALNKYASAGGVRAGMAYAGADLAGMDVDAAAGAVGGAVNKKIESGMASFLYQGTEYAFQFSSVGLEADFSNIKAALSSNGTRPYLSSLLSAFTRIYSDEVKPVYKADPEAFRKKLLVIKEFIDCDPVDAGIEYAADGEIIKTESSDGAVFDVDNYFDIISEQFCADPFAPFALDAQPRDGRAFVEQIKPRVPDSLIGDIESALAAIEADIPADYNPRYVAGAAEAINKVWAPKKGKAYDSFSFLRYLREAGLPEDLPATEYDFVASALLHALLICGMDQTKMEFVLSGNTGAYTALPGMDVCMIGGKAKGASDSAEPDDFRFSNTLNTDIVIFASVQDGRLRIAIAGNSKAYNGFEISSSEENGRVLLFRDGRKIAEYL